MLSNTADPTARREPTTLERRWMRNGREFAIWTFVFAASFLAGHWIASRTDWIPDGVGGVAISLIPIVPGLLAFRSFMTLFREADELMHKILVEGILFGFGAVILFWGAIQLPEHIWLPKVSADIVMAVMMLSWALGGMLAIRRYK